jgi:hypothetical protein
VADALFDGRKLLMLTVVDPLQGQAIGQGTNDASGLQRTAHHRHAERPHRGPGHSAGNGTSIGLRSGSARKRT